MIGQLIDNRYRIEAVLGRGGMGAVYRAIDETARQPVALKLLHAFIDAGNDIALKRFQREFRVLAQLDHPRIVQAHSYGYFQDSPYLVLELLSGHTLSQELAAGSLPRERQLLIAQQICEALDYLHGRCIVHRDLKPGNLMLLSPDNGVQIKLMDFGLARNEDASLQLTQEGMALGTMAYIAPEQAQGFPVDFRADLYALGIIMYEMAAGRPPFVHENPAVMLMNQLTLTPPSPRRFNPNIDEPLEQLILQLLAKEPAQRPASVQHLSSQLARLADQTVVLPTAVPEHRPDLIPRVPLIGREQIIGELVNRWEEARGGQGSLIMLPGVAGAGKSRLLTEASVQARLAGSPYHHGHCREHASLPYQPIVEILSPLVRHQAAGQQLSVPPELAQLLPGSSGQMAVPAATINPAEARPRMFAACRELLQTISQTTPLMLAIEDVQWIDPTSLELLVYLASHIHQVNILLIITYRSEEIHSQTELHTALQNLRRAANSHYLPVGLLSQPDVARYLQAALGKEKVPDKVVQSFFQSTNGNPLFIEETLKTLAEEGHVAEWSRASRTRWNTVTSFTLPLPKTVLSLAERRLQLLSDDDRSILTTAAVLGPEFSFTLLETVTRLDEDTLLDAIDRLLAARLIEELPVRHGDDYYGFGQEALRQALLSTVSQRRRRRMHQRTGEAIENIFDTGQARYWPVLAYHFAEAGDARRALKYFTLAGDAAAQLYANAEAVAHYSQALDLIEANPDLAGDKQLLHLFTNRGRNLELADHFPEAAENYEAMEKLGHKRADPLLEMGALHALATICATPTPVRNLPRAEKLAKRALALARAHNNCEAEAKALWNLTLVYKFTERPQKAVDAGERSIAIARDLNLKEQLAFSLNDVAWAYMAVTEPDRATAALAEARELWRELGNLPMLADNLASSAGHVFLSGNIAEARELADETLRISEAIDNTWNQVQGWMALGLLHLIYGEFGKSIKYLEKSIALSKTGSWDMPQVTNPTELGWIYAALGDIDRGIAMCRDAATLAGKIMPEAQGYPLAMLAKLCLMKNDVAAAEQALAELQPLIGSNNFTLAIVWRGLAEAELARKNQDYDRALQVANQLSDQLIQLKIKAFLPFIWHTRATILFARGDSEEARLALVEARDLAQAQTSRYILLLILNTLSWLEGRRGNATEARRLGQEAREIIQFIANHAPPSLRQRFLEQPLIQTILTGVHPEL
jgi:predicted ATPase